MDFQPTSIPPDRSRIAIGAVILVAIAGAIGFWIGWQSSQPPASTPPADVTSGVSPLAAGALISGEHAIAVSDQAPGMRVNISFVTLAEHGWVAIHDDVGGRPGPILGAQRFDAGQNQSGAVELLRGTEEGRVYYAMLHRDDGDRQFDHTKDLPVTDGQGNVVLMRFVATSQPPAP